MHKNILYIIHILPYNHPLHPFFIKDIYSIDIEQKKEGRPSRVALLKSNLKITISFYPRITS
jgi:hypothetical protein